MVDHMANSTAYIQISRHNVYYFRIRIPLHLQASLKQTYIRRSLQTKYRQQAVRRGAKLLQQVFEIFDNAETCVAADLNLIQWVQELPQKPIEDVLTPQPVVSIPQEKAISAPLLSAVLQEYFINQRLEKVSERTIRTKQGVANLFYQIVGDRPVDEYTREMMQDFKATALKLPPRLNQLGDITIAEAIERATTNISITTFNNYVKELGTIFTFAVRAGYCQRNPCEGLKIKLKVKANSQRSRFDTDDITAVFSTDVHQPSDRAPQDFQYWIPLLGLFTGARLNELSQLYISDIVEMSGIDCIHIQAVSSGQRLKSPTSERVIPIHSKLKSLGFMDYVQLQRERNSSRLFPELKPHKHHGYGAKPSKWFARLRASIGLTEDSQKKDFHSFRHTLADELKQRGVAESLIAGILGHSTGGITFGRYGKDYTPEVLAPVIEMLDWDLSHIHSYHELKR